MHFILLSFLFSQDLISLKLNLPVGFKYRTVVETTLSNSSTPGRAVTQSVELREVLSVDADVYTYRVTLEPPTKNVVSMFSQILGQSFTFMQAASLKFADVYAATSMKPAEYTDFLRLQNRFQNNPFIFPKKPVRIGEVWRSETAMTDEGTDTIMTSELKVVGKEELNNEMCWKIECQLSGYGSAGNGDNFEVEGTARLWITQHRSFPLKLEAQINFKSPNTGFSEVVLQHLTAKVLHDPSAQ